MVLHCCPKHRVVWARLPPLVCLLFPGVVLLLLSAITNTPEGRNMRKLTVRGKVLPRGSFFCCRRRGHALRRRESLRSESEDGGRRYGCVRQLLPFRRHGGREEEHQQYLPVRRAKWS